MGQGQVYDPCGTSWYPVITASSYKVIFIVMSVITSATEGEGGCSHLFLSVYLCTGYLKKLWTDSDEILWAGWVCDKDEVIRFW